MKHAFLSDIHANEVALNAVLDDMAAKQVTSVLCLGDLVGYGPRPREVLEQVRALTPNHLLGNHDAAVCGIIDPTDFNDEAARIARWTAGQLTDEQKEFLRDLPLMIEGDGFRCTHAEFSEPEAFWYLEDEESARAAWEMYPEEPLMCIGHTHEPMVHTLSPEGAYEVLPPEDFVLRDGWRHIVNVGSVGLPRDGDARACYATYDEISRRVDFHRVHFDVTLHAAQVKDSMGPNPQALILLETYELQQAGHMTETQAIRLEDWSPERSAARFRVKARPKTGSVLAHRPMADRTPPPRSKLPFVVAGAVLAVIVLAVVLAAIFAGGPEPPAPPSPFEAAAPGNQPAGRAPKIEIVATRAPEPSAQPIWAPPPPTLSGQVGFWDFTVGFDCEGFPPPERIGSPRIEGDPAHRYLHLDGASALRWKSSPTWSFRETFTIGCWIRFPDGAKQPEYAALLTKGEGSWRLSLDKEGKHPQICVNKTPNLRKAVGTKPIDDGAWHHVVCTKLKSVLRLFVDGEVAGEIKTSSVTRTTDDDVCLGDNTGYFGARRPRCDLDRLTISSDPVSTQTVQEWFRRERGMYR